MDNSWVLNSSIGRKIAMSLSAFFLIIFLTQHLVINFSSVISSEMFNSVAHFMGTNPVVQFVIQPILIIAIIFHLIMGIVLEIKNKRARGGSYAYKAGKNANSSWTSRNMYITGFMIFAFLVMHLYDFWIFEIIGKVSGTATDDTRYYTELVNKFEDPLRVALYVLAFILLGLHLNHGFQSAFQSIGLSNDTYAPILKKFSVWFSVLVPLGFITIALYHFITKS